MDVRGVWGGRAVIGGVGISSAAGAVGGGTDARRAEAKSSAVYGLMWDGGGCHGTLRPEAAKRAQAPGGVFGFSQGTRGVGGNFSHGLGARTP